MRIFLISPVRGISDEEKERVEQYVVSRERQGDIVHWPIRDTNQSDPIGNRICQDNFNAMYNADQIHVWLNPTSTGTLFDLGGYFMMRWMIKNVPLKFVNKEDFPDDLQGKSFVKLLKWLDQQGGIKSL